MVLCKWSPDFFNQRPTQKIFAFGEGVVQKVNYIGTRLKTMIVRKTKMCYRKLPRFSISILSDTAGFTFIAKV